MTKKLISAEKASVAKLIARDRIDEGASARRGDPMAKKLIIAEKPSVANDIARALGGFTRHGDYFESNEYGLSSAIGHLLELVPPEGHELKRGKWSFANLPVIPPH